MPLRGIAPFCSSEVTSFSAGMATSLKVSASRPLPPWRREPSRHLGCLRRIELQQPRIQSAAHLDLWKDSGSKVAGASRASYVFTNPDARQYMLTGRHHGGESVITTRPKRGLPVPVSPMVTRSQSVFIDSTSGAAAALVKLVKAELNCGV